MSSSTNNSEIQNFDIDEPDEALDLGLDDEMDD
jgi:hypothetical protein